MNLKVVPIPSQTDVTPIIIEALEALLRKAREGELQNFLFVGIARSGGALEARSFEVCSPRYALIGALENRIRTLHDILDAGCRSEEHFSGGEP